MRIMILGYDGYIGYALTQDLLKEGHEVFGIDDGSRRTRVNWLGSQSVTPIASMIEREDYLKTTYGAQFDYRHLTIGIDNAQRELSSALYWFQPEVIVHLAEQPSAAWSMRNVLQACATQQENVIGTLQLLFAMKEHCPNAHLIKLGTMGEYGTPGCVIPEGVIPHHCIGELDFLYKEPNRQCPMGNLLFPRTAGSFYHLSKVHDTHNIEFACRIWGLRSTDIMQGVVFGLNEASEDVQLTRFDQDECFGTVINRFCAQALINVPLTVYGKGGQTRGYLPLSDSIDCIKLAINNPPSEGTYRTFNQFAYTYSVESLAVAVVSAADSLGFPASVGGVTNPRVEAESHYYRPLHDNLRKLGYEPSWTMKDELNTLLKRLSEFVLRIKEEVIIPTINWK